MIQKNKKALERTLVMMKHLDEDEPFDIPSDIEISEETDNIVRYVLALLVEEKYKRLLAEQRVLNATKRICCGVELSNN